MYHILKSLFLSQTKAVKMYTGPSSLVHWAASSYFTFLLNFCRCGPVSLSALSGCAYTTSSFTLLTSPCLFVFPVLFHSVLRLYIVEKKNSRRGGVGHSRSSSVLWLPFYYIQLSPDDHNIKLCVLRLQH